MTLAIDGSSHLANPFGSTTTPSLSLTTTQSNDIIILLVGRNPGNTISSVIGSTIGAFTQIAPNPDGLSAMWACFAASPLTSETVTITQSNNWDNVYDLIGVSGSGQTSLTGAFDAGGPVYGTGLGSAAPVSITTVNANTMVIGVYGFSYVGSIGGPGSGFTLISDVDHVISEYKVLSATATTSVTTAYDPYMSSGVIFAVVQGGGGPAPVTGSLVTTEAAEAAAFFAMIGTQKRPKALAINHTIRRAAYW